METPSEEAEVVERDEEREGRTAREGGDGRRGRTERDEGRSDGMRVVSTGGTDGEGKDDDDGCRR